MKNPSGKGYHIPLKPSNKMIWLEYLENAKKFLLNCKNRNRKLMCITKKKTPFIGFAITVTSIIGIVENYVGKDNLKYLLSYKLSQDHL